MSYILEALKKAQAERQLGALPTIHAPAPQAAATGHPLYKSAGLVVMVLALLALSLLLWRQPWQGAAPAIRPQTLAVAAPATPTATAPAPAPAAPVPALAPVPASVRAPVRHPAASSSPASAMAQAKVAAPPPAAASRAAAPVAAQPGAGGEESVTSLRDLPEPIQRQIPQLALGGYIYSKNPADRLLLIDKVLRHEGEEVAPGLILETLQPKAAVFSFKGYRYRIAY